MLLCSHLAWGSATRGKLNFVVLPWWSEAVLWSHSRHVPHLFCGCAPSVPPWLMWINGWNAWFCFWLLLCASGICSLMYIYFGALLSQAVSGSCFPEHPSSLQSALFHGLYFSQISFLIQFIACSDKFLHQQKQGRKKYAKAVSI